MWWILILICGGYIIDAVITTEDSRCQYEESITRQTFIVGRRMAALPLAFVACNTSHGMVEGNSLSLDSIRRESNTEFPYAKILFMDININNWRRFVVLPQGADACYFVMNLDECVGELFTSVQHAIF